MGFRNQVNQILLILVPSAYEIYLDSLPFCAISMVLSFFLLRGRTLSGRLSGKPFKQKLLIIDWFGALLFIGAGILVLLGLNWGSTGTWKTVRVIVSLVVGGLLFVAFFCWEHIVGRHEISQGDKEAGVGDEERTSRWPTPMIPLELFKSYDICAVQYTVFVAGMVMLVMFYFVAIFMTIVNGLSATRSGVQLVYFAPGMVRNCLFQPYSFALWVFV